MCGGGSYSAPSPPPKPGWNTFWDDIKLDRVDKGIFIEVTQGCDAVSCKLQCQARDMSKRIMPFGELEDIFNFLASVEHPDIMLYGVGDVTHYHWHDFLSIKGLKVPLSRINISPTAKDEDILALARRNISINFNVNTPEEAILANMKQRNLGCRMSSIVVPVVRTVDWLEILKTSAINIEFNSFTPSWSELYISPQEFKDGMMSLGIEVAPVVYKLKSGLKPVIERCQHNEGKYIFTIRRCFQPDSGKITLESDDKLINNWAKNHKKTFNKLNELGSMNTTCSKCSKTVWYYNFKR